MVAGGAQMLNKRVEKRCSLPVAMTIKHEGRFLLHLKMEGRKIGVGQSGGSGGGERLLICYLYPSLCNLQKYFKTYVLEK